MEWSTIGYMLLFALGCFVLWFIIEMFDANSDAKAMMEHQQKEDELKKKNDTLLPTLKEKKQELINLYGNLAKQINITKEDVDRPLVHYDDYLSNRLENFIFVFEEKQMIFICGRLLKFDQILKADYTNHATGSTQQILPTKTSTENILKRGIIGGAIAGPIGAVIGGATAKHKYSTEEMELRLLQQQNALLSDYSTITITIDDFSEPIIEIDLNNYYAGESKAKEILSVLQIIINRNESTLN